MTDTGPPYPPPAGPGSNAIGSFAIGVSAIGTIEAFDPWATIISQYANSPIITGIIEDMFAWLDQTANFDLLYDNIWNIESAVAYGLDVWGRIVGVNRVLKVTVGDWFGFAEALPGSDSFNQGAFYSGQPLTDNFALSDQAYRSVILAKAAANITDGSIPSINQILINLFPSRGNCYVTEGQSYAYFGFAEARNTLEFNQGIFYSGQTLAIMTMTYTFEFPLSPLELAIVEQSGVLPKSTGVSASVVLDI